MSSPAPRVARPRPRHRTVPVVLAPDVLTRAVADPAKRAAFFEVLGLAIAARVVGELLAPAAEDRPDEEPSSSARSVHSEATRPASDGAGARGKAPSDLVRGAA